MKDGIYGINFSAQGGQGLGMLVFESGRIYGADAGCAKYDGTYTVNPKTGMADVKLHVEMPAGQPSVIGISQPFDWMLDVTTAIDPSKEKGDVVVNSNLGRQLRAHYEFIRPLPLM